MAYYVSPMQDTIEWRVETYCEKAEDLSAKVCKVLGIVRHNSLRLLKLVNDILDVIRLEEGIAQPDKQAIIILF